MTKLADNAHKNFQMEEYVFPNADSKRGSEVNELPASTDAIYTYHYGNRKALSETRRVFYIDTSDLPLQTTYVETSDTTQGKY